MSKHSGPLKVIFIAGAGRSGSTLLDRLLGHVDGLVSVGEASFLWSRGLQQGWICGCGQAVNACHFWTRVLDQLQSQVGCLDPEAMEAALRKAGKNRAIPMYILPWARRRFLTRIRRHQEVLRVLYGSIARMAGAEVVVDSSKNPGYGFLLDSTPGLEVSCIHLVRDPRAVAYSWSQNKPGRGRPGDRSMATKGAVESSLEWMRFTVGGDILAARAGGGGIRVRYEDFTVRPEQTLRAALSLVGMQTSELDFLDGARASLGPTHSVSGNPDRLEQVGAVDIRARNDWRERQSSWAQLIVSTLAWPQMLRYGYSIGILADGVGEEHNRG